MAPEIVKRPKSGFEGKPADIFSLGVAFFIMLYGIPPFTEASKDDNLYGFFAINYPKMFFKKHARTAKQIMFGEIDKSLVQLFSDVF